MPLGKSGKHYYSPHEMSRQGDSPDLTPESEPQEDSQPDEPGDGNHHHEIVMHDDGTAHSTHTHPDGQTEEADHGSYDEAKQHMDQVMDPGDDSDQDTEDGPNNSESDIDHSDRRSGSDLAGMYSPGK